MHGTIDNTRLAQAWQHDGGSLLVQKAGLAMATAVLILGLAVMFSTRGGEIGNSLVQVFTCQLGRFGGGGGAGCGAPAATTPGGGGGGAPSVPQADSGGGGGWLDGLQTALDVIGLIPVIGEPVDLVNGVIYAARGDWLNAGLSFTAMIPIGGQAATGSKLVLKYGDEAVAVVRNGERVADAAPHWRRFPCYNSFTATTPVLTPSGLVPISAIEIGDHVLAWNSATGTTGAYTVTNVISHRTIAPKSINVVLTIDGQRLVSTPEHRFYTVDRGWVEAKDLRVAERIRTIDSDVATVQGFAIEARTSRMYNLTVATAHTFFVGTDGWLVHNTDCDWWLVDPENYVKVRDRTLPAEGGPPMGAIGRFDDNGNLRQIGLYDHEGNVVFHIDAPDGHTNSWHYHVFVPGNPQTGHGAGAGHHRIDDLERFLRERGFDFDDWNVAP
ncbi:MAG: polymorphic toxin-type HINT domain-containing protein [Chloroflexaceae bacterium]|nr:polymorphic toxin-type HINT domain-containing protein [Chloroflexaceae bacterium]